MVRAARFLYAAITLAFVVGILLQVYFIGLGLFSSADFTKIHAEFGVPCLIELVLPHTLPRTSSGKLSRSSARKEFIERVRAENAASPTCFISDETLFRQPARAAAPELALSAGS